MATNDPVIWVFPILIRAHSETEVSGSSSPSPLRGEWYSFNYYLYTTEQSALRTWMWCSCGSDCTRLVLHFISSTNIQHLRLFSSIYIKEMINLHITVSLCGLVSASFREIKSILGAVHLYNWLVELSGVAQLTLNDAHFLHEVLLLFCCYFFQPIAHRML